MKLCFLRLSNIGLPCKTLISVGTEKKQCTNVLRTAFTLVDPKSVKYTVKLSVSFYAFGICERKSCT